MATVFEAPSVDIKAAPPGQEAAAGVARISAEKNQLLHAWRRARGHSVLFYPVSGLLSHSSGRSRTGTSLRSSRARYLQQLAELSFRQSTGSRPSG